MHLKKCCEDQKVVWRQSRVQNRWADVQICLNCEHIHRMESWLVPLQYDLNVGCANCGGKRPRKGKPDAKCSRCGLTMAKDRAFHDRLATSFRHRTFLEAAIEASEIGRHVVALKLATAALTWERAFDDSMRVRVQSLLAIGRLDDAIESTLDWTQHNPPVDVWPLLADLQAQGGNIQGALEALESGLIRDEDNSEMWTDFAELLAHVNDLPTALEAASRAIGDESQTVRCLQVITEIATRYFELGQFDDAVTASKYAGGYQERSAQLSWLRAQVATFNADNEAALGWAEAVLRLEPEHTEATALRQRLAPSRPNKGWFW